MDTTLTEGIEQCDPENYKNSLTVTSYDGLTFFGWAACRREGVHLVQQPQPEHFPLRVAQAAKYRKRA